MRKLADAKENPHIFRTEQTCTGKGWNQNGKVPCYSLWEISAADIMKRTSSDYSGDTETSYGFVCPDCGCFTEIAANKLPWHVKSNATTYSCKKEVKDVEI